jgi:bifunctional non-homologous end joining protein LigD
MVYNFSLNIQKHHMNLSVYKKKRNFTKTPEPSGHKQISEKELIFVVQQHDASHLHYDFRLEMEGVLKSWAIPKGPSMNPEDKRLAMMVEDHPYTYKDFEGTIPEGNYGAGNVIVWDNGTYHAYDNKGRKEDEKKLLEGLKKGHITFILKGKKLKGEFALIKLKNGQGSAWLLVKKGDKYAMNEDILKKDRSVLSRKKLQLRDRSKPRKVIIKRKSSVKKKVVQLTNQDKIYFPKDNITKGDVVSYYKEIATVILPYLKDRPQSMHRFPNGIKGTAFFQKDVDKSKVPDWIQTIPIFSESTKKNVEYLICNDQETLMFMANLGCIEINPWNSRVQTLDNPDWVAIDLDPEKINFKEVVTTAIEIKKFLDELEVESYCKTSGASGLHIYIPLARKYEYEIARGFAQLIAQNVFERNPSVTSLLRSPAKRQKKVYLDFLQNSKGQTLAAPYSIRPKPGATVSTPLEWKELNDKLDPSNFTIKNIFKRLEKKGDLWKPVLGKGIDLHKILKKLNKE